MDALQGKIQHANRVLKKERHKLLRRVALFAFLYIVVEGILGILSLTSPDESVRKVAVSLYLRGVSLGGLALLAFIGYYIYHRIHGKNAYYETCLPALLEEVYGVFDHAGQVLPRFTGERSGRIPVTGTYGTITRSYPDYAIELGYFIREERRSRVDNAYSHLDGSRSGTTYYEISQRVEMEIALHTPLSSLKQEVTLRNRYRTHAADTFDAVFTAEGDLRPLTGVEAALLDFEAWANEIPVTDAQVHFNPLQIRYTREKIVLQLGVLPVVESDGSTSEALLLYSRDVLQELLTRVSALIPSP